MSLQLQNLTVHGLYGDRRIDIPIDDDRLVLVGDNGVGKSTVISMLFYLMTFNWRRLRDYPFDSLSLQLGGETLDLSAREIEEGSTVVRRHALLIRRTLPHLPPQASELLLAPEASPSQLRDLSERFAVPLHQLTLLRDSYASSSREASVLTNAQAWLRERIRSKVLFLPTYRRIEKDLGVVFPEIDAHLRDFRRSRPPSSSGQRSALELVEFGMEDVQTTLNRTTARLRETARAELNNLAGSYLRDVIRSEAQTYDVRAISEIPDDGVTAILGRVERDTLTEEDTTRLRNVIHRVRTSPSQDTLDPGDRYLAHFFAKLIGIHNALTSQEADIKRFTQICSRYLSGKAFAYDRTTYKLPLVSESRHELALKDLSSGEKQIVSLFCHLLLESSEPCVVLVDEPELSLAVEWQRQLLPDLWASGRCAFLCAVTHSPFIFENEFDAYARDLREFITPL